MKTRAAVAFQAGKPLEVVDVDLEGPKAGEVLIELKATGVCHTDAFTLSGDDPEGAFPAILGHESSETPKRSDPESAVMRACVCVCVQVLFNERLCACVYVLDGCSSEPFLF